MSAYTNINRNDTNDDNDENDQVMDFSEEALQSLEKKKALIRQISIENRAKMLVVPTNDTDVRRTLRQFSEPITLFGEEPAERRDRLKKLVATLEHERDGNQDGQGRVDTSSFSASNILKEDQDMKDSDEESSEEEQTEVFYTKGRESLKNIRMYFAKRSLDKANRRIQKQKVLRQKLKEESFDVVDNIRKKKSFLLDLKKIENTSSQIGCIRPIHSIDAKLDEINSLSTSKEQSSFFLLTGSWRGSIKLWNSANCSLLRSYDGHVERVVDVRFNPNHKVQYEEWKKVKSEVKDEEDEEMEDIESTTVRKLNGTVVASSEAKMNIQNGNHSQENSNNVDIFTEESSISNTLSFASADAEGTVKLWSINQKKPLSVVRAHEKDRISKIGFHDDGRFLVTTSFDETWKLWDMETQKEALKQEGHNSEVYGVSFHPDGSICGTTDFNGMALLWDIRTGKCILPLKGHTFELLSIDFSPNGINVVTGGYDNSVRVWDLRTKKCLYTIPSHLKPVKSVKFEPIYGRYIMSASHDRTIRLWTNIDFLPIKKLEAHSHIILDATVVKDKQERDFIFSCSYDKTWKGYSTDEHLYDL